MAKESLCPSFYCSKCKKDHSGECIPPYDHQATMERIKRLFSESLAAGGQRWRQPISLDDHTNILTPDGYKYSEIGTIRNPPADVASPDVTKDDDPHQRPPLGEDYDDDDWDLTS